jgi:hypothetical protein
MGYLELATKAILLDGPPQSDPLVVTTATAADTRDRVVSVVSVESRAAPITDPTDLIDALVAAARALWDAHVVADEGAIDRAWSIYQGCNGRYCAWSRAQPRAMGRAMDRRVAGLLRAQGGGA